MLYIVGTPIGNLKDITLRALETLKSVDEIACEDTRHTLKLLSFYDIKKPLFAYHKFNERSAGENLADQLESGKNIALVTDAGMPLISDPGSVLVKILVERNIPFTVVPGPTAFTSALVLSGLLDYRFSFVGFIPDKNKERRELLEKYKNADCPLVFYCAPHDLDDTIKSLFKVFGNRKAVAVREITKTFEERVEFNLEDGYQGEKRGEFVLIVEGGKMEEKSFDMPIKEHVEMYLKSGMSKKDAVKQVAKERNLQKNDVYKYVFSDENQVED